MKSSRKKLLGLLALLLFLVPLGMLVRKAYQELRQTELNRALIVAVKNNDTAKVVSLLAKGADADARDLLPDKRSVWWRLWDRLRGKPLQSDHAHTALLVALEMNDAYIPSMFLPENVPLIKALLDARATVNIADENGETPLMWAAMDTKRETVRLLLDRGAEINARDSNGCTALYSAAPESDPALVRLLITRGALVNVTGIRRATPLQLAAGSHRITIVRMLLDSGSDVNTRDEDGDTPLSIAALEDDIGIVKLLLERGAQVNIRDKDGNTAMTWAQMEHYTQLIHILKAAALQQARGKR